MTFQSELNTLAADVKDTFHELSVTLQDTANNGATYTASTGKRAESVTTQTLLVNKQPSRSIRPSIGESSGYGEVREYVCLAADVTLNSGAIVPGRFRIVDNDVRLEVTHVVPEADRKFLRITASIGVKAGAV